MTNADWIKAMDIEELALLIDDSRNYFSCSECDRKQTKTVESGICEANEDYLPHIKKWLEKEAVRYRLIAYDKDHDMEICYGCSESLYQLTKQGERLKEALENDRLKNPETGEPFDWMEIVEENNRDRLHWVSYDLPYHPIMRGIYLKMKGVL